MRSVSFFFSFLRDRDPVKITINAIDWRSAKNYGIYFLHGDDDGKFVVGVGVGLLLQDLLER